ncbi:MAG: glucosyltransferase domain-containing protein [bacterium]|nr:glucosyltransferase domain-containing protein [bacterium]
MMSPEELFRKIRKKIKKEWKAAFFSAVIIGLLVHMPVMTADIPNHDGLDSLYFDQNMITSGRWFLMAACSLSSFYTVPWLIGLIGIFFLGLTAAALTELLEVNRVWAASAVGGLLAAFPALASTFAYVFTLDGYMLAMLLAVLAVLFTKQKSRGFLPGAVCLAFSLGIYQGYLSFATVLSVFAILILAAEQGERKAKVRQGLRYLYMGALGVALYYGILQILLRLQGKELADYQGIDGMAAGTAASGGIFRSIGRMYRDFAGFSLKGNVLFQNGISLAACIVLALSALSVLAALAVKRKWWKNPCFFVIIGMAAVLLPPATNIILLVSPNVTYHLLMRYQWVLYPIGAVALAGGRLGQASEKSDPNGRPSKGYVAEWAALAAAFVLVFFYGVTDNIGYSNLQKRYEKTYAYCVRLLDRIEQTPGYYQGIPIAMIGVVGDVEFPPTDLTASVTSNMIGLNGDVLLYTGENYKKFIQSYLGATLNILPPEAMGEMYYDGEYIAMDSFPGENSIRIIDGIMYIKTENKTTD